MPGQHIGREARYSETKITDQQRDEIILKLHNKGWSQRQIGKTVGMTQPAVKYAIDRMTGKPRSRSRYLVCDFCGGNFTKDQLTEGLCLECLES